MKTQSPKLTKSVYLTVLLSTALTSFSYASIEEDRKVATFAPQQTNSYLITDNRIIDKEKILEDRDHKISDEFRVPTELKSRVSFWFDVYTKYSAQEEVIHHAEYPWIVFRVVDLRPILDADGHKWTKYHKSKKFARAQMKEVKSILISLSKRKNYSKLSPDQQEMFDKLAEIPGKRKNVIKYAIASLRTQVGQKDYIEQGLNSSSLYMQKLEEIFEANNLPKELSRLPFVESSFNTEAVSKVGASGIWQVMPYIGKKLLVMSDHIDERNSPVKSAKAAAYILKENKMILKNWPLALTAYNHGAGSILNAIKKTRSHDLNVMIKKYNAKSFGFASQNFYSSFLAILHAEKYKYETYKYVAPQIPLEFKEIKLTRKMKLNRLLDLAGLTREDLQKYNLDIKDSAFKKNVYLPKGFVVHVPKDAAELVVSKAKKLALLIESNYTIKL